MSDISETGRVAVLGGRRGKRGSALMIVIGFLSFMIVSAVAFSIYMRAERLPSSALRRTVASRQLAKAALAEAIARVDDSVRGSAFPGLFSGLILKGSSEQYYRPRGYPEHWEGRVFMPPPDGTSGNKTEEEGIADRAYYAPVGETVSVLTLEGLGYLPAPLINDARFLGRSSYTAKWQNLPYDAGRFAFVALNVSDYFDVNRLHANMPRTSNSDGRISLAYLLDPKFHPLGQVPPSFGLSMFWPGQSVDNFSNVDEFEQIAHENRPSGDGGGGNSIGGDAPYVSMLDFNLAMKNKISALPSPFYEWIYNNSGGGKMYTSEQKLFAAAKQSFVTESCATNETWAIDISTAEGQPFGQEVKQDNISFLIVNSKAAGSKFFTPLANVGTDRVKFVANPLQGLSIISATLFDYLDHNDVPLSLAWPCVERVPMFTAVEPVGSLLKIPAVTATTQDDTTTWMFNLNEWLGAGTIKALYAFPFKRNGAERNDTFKAQAIVRVILAPDGINLRAEALGNALRPQNAQWNQDKFDMFDLNGVRNVFCLSFKLEAMTPQINLPDYIEKEENAGGLIDFKMINIDSINNPAPTPLVTRRTVRNTNNGVTTTTEEYTVNVSPLGPDGKPLFAVVGQPIDKGAFDAIAGTPLRPYVCVWMRITNGDGKTVDLVPAVIDDDRDLNSGNSQVPVLSEYLLGAQDGPILRFQGDKTFNYSTMVSGAAPAGGEVQWDPKAFCALDPRFNWAPEDWYATEAGMTDFSKWLNKTKEYIRAHSDDCDSDIFFAVSNQGVLQSLGEFAFLPRLTDIYGGGTTLLTMKGASGGYDGVVRTSPESVANKRCAWRSYEMNRDVYDYFKVCGIGRSASRECLVNPYTLDSSILMAAIANTPCDYWAAGAALKSLKKPTNSDTIDLQSRLPDSDVTDAASAVKNFAFSSKNAEAQITGEELDMIATHMQNCFRDKAKFKDAFAEMQKRSPMAQMADTWEEIWDRLWGVNEDPDKSYCQMGGGMYVRDGNFNRLFGDVNIPNLLRPLHGVDRKFLYSYWRDCFANRQQLFLIFVRAESSAIGGPGEGTPGQKGARAVALVWRNPAATTDTSTGVDGRTGDNDPNEKSLNNLERRPHQTRVLFYHQFD